jgi:hypothetical protein
LRGFKNPTQTKGLRHRNASEFSFEKQFFILFLNILKKKDELFPKTVICLAQKMQWPAEFSSKLLHSSAGGS